jgi:hypothetical protein
MLKSKRGKVFVGGFFGFSASFLMVVVMAAAISIFEVENVIGKPSQSSILFWGLCFGGIGGCTCSVLTSLMLERDED